MCEDNQKYLIAHSECALMKACVRLIGLCHERVGGRDCSPRIFAPLTAAVRVLMNLSHNNGMYFSGSS